MTQPHHQFFDFYRASLRATGDSIGWSLEGAERLRSHQLAVIKEAQAAHAEVSAMINDAKGFEDLAAIPGKLANIQSRTMLSYWGGLYRMASESQSEVASRMQAQMEQIRDNSQKMLGATTDGQVPMLAALQPLVNAASSVYALGTRATEEATKFATGTWKTAGAVSTRGTDVNRHQRAA